MAASTEVLRCRECWEKAGNFQLLSFFFLTSKHVPIILSAEAQFINECGRCKNQCDVHTCARLCPCTHRFKPKLMRQIYDGCWPQQIKLTVMYVGGRVSRCTNGPHTHTHTQPAVLPPCSQSLLLGFPVRQPPLQHTCIMKFLTLICVSPAPSCVPPVLRPLSIPRLTRLPASCRWRTASHSMTTGQCAAAASSRFCETEPRSLVISSACVRFVPHTSSCVRRKL